MFGISMWEFGLILLVVLLVYGPEGLPEATKTFGKVMEQLRRSSDQLRREFYQSVYTPVEDLHRDLKKVDRDLRTSTRTLVTSVEGSIRDATLPPVAPVPVGGPEQVAAPQPEPESDPFSDPSANGLPNESKDEPTP